jgi:tape measure domain-containing protein
MAGKFNFTAKIGLDSAEFHKGVNKVRGSLNGLKTTFLQVAGALGAGLGLTQLIGSVRTTATELSNTMNTLKNVSYQTKAFKDGTEEVTVEVSNFADNLAFVRKLAKDYHQDLVAITDNYAKFTAACKKTNMGLEEQRFVFEALTKAAAFYHLSADRTNDMMNAVVQMMSKGKVAAEELRRQLGNTLPGAFNLMAAALGVSTAKLEDMMKNGEVISSEVLPRFAAMLNSVTQNIEFDSIQSSMNDLKNTWYEFVQKSGAENLYKNIIDGSVSALSYVTDNMKGIKSTMVGLITYFASVNLFGHFEKQGERMVAEATRRLDYLKTSIVGLKKKIDAFGAKQGQYGAYTHANPTSLTDHQIRQMQMYNNHLSEQATLQYKLGVITKAQYDATQREIAQATMLLTGLTTETNASTVAAGRLKMAWNGIGEAVGKFGQKMGEFLKSNWIFLLISAIVSIWNYISRIREEAEKIKEISKEYAEEITGVEKKTDEQAAKLKNNLKVIKDIKASESSRILALKEINKLLGLTGSKAFDVSVLEDIENKYNDIATAVERWIKATKKQAMIQAYASQIADASAKKGIAEGKLEQKKPLLEAFNKIDLSWGDYLDIILGGGNGGSILAAEGALWKSSHDLEREIENLEAEVAQYQNVIEIAEAAMKEHGLSLGEFYDILGGGGNGEEGSLSSIMEKYNKEEKELANQIKEGALSQEKYNEAFDKLVQEFWKKAAATGELAIEDITKKFDSGATLTAMEKWYYDLAKNAREAAVRALLAEAEKTMEKVTDEAIKEHEKLFEEQLDDYLDKQAKKAEKQLELDMGVLGGEYKPDKRKDRNTLFDYDKTGSEKTNDELEKTNEWLDSIKDNYKDLIEESNELGYRTEIVQKELDKLSELYRYAAKEAKTLEAAMNYQKVVEDIKDVKKEINNLTYSGVKDFATSIDRVVSASKTLQETFENTDSSGWAKFMALFNMITQVIDSAIGIYQTITTIQELQAKIGAAKIAEQMALNQLLKEELALRMAAQGASQAEIAQRFEGIGALLAEKGVLAGILGLKQAEGAQTATNTALKGAEAGVTAAAASASAGEAVANATASGAKMPYPLNLIAIATGIAAVIAALASMKKFAHGGIVGGNSTHGDRNIARVNSGEMILNKAQQGTLWGLLNGKGSIGGNVEFKIRGADLVGTINNYSKKISK